MTWTAPRTWVTGEVLTSANMNTHLRDNLLYLGQADGVASTPPGAPQDRQGWWYPADATNGVLWAFKYAAGSANASKWEFDGGPPLYAETTGTGSTTSLTYAAPPNGPDITLARAGDYLIQHGMDIQTGAAGEKGRMSYAIGAVAASENDACFGAATQAPASQPSKARVQVGIGAATTIASRYRSEGGNSITFQLRWLSILPVRVA